MIGFIFIIPVYIFKTYSSITSEYYYWGLGYSIGKLGSIIFVAVNDWGNLGIFRRPHMKRRERWIDMMY